MKCPKGYTEDEVLAIIEKCVNQLAPKFVFGYFDLEDAKQQGRLEALELLESGKYDPSKALAGFVYVHIHNRYCNWKRNTFRRNDPPCVRCHEGDYCTAEGRQPCERYTRWNRLNNQKANLLRPLDLHHYGEDGEHSREASVMDSLMTEEWLRKLDEELPVELRGAFLRLKEGLVVPKADREAVGAAIRGILGGEA